MQTFNVGVKKGDVVVLATDGLIDNVYPQEAASIVSIIQKRGDAPRVAASGLAEYAKFRCSDCPPGQHHASGWSALSLAAEGRIMVQVNGREAPIAICLRGAKGRLQVYGRQAR